MGTSDGRRARQHCINVDLGEALLASLEPVRRTIQDDLPGRPTVTRGDVVRLALRLFLLRVLRRQVEIGEDASVALEEWARVAGDLTADPATPGWARPTETDVPQTSKRYAKKGGKK